MTASAMLLYGSLFLLSMLLILQGYALYLKRGATSRKHRRRWARITVPTERMISCRIMEPPGDDSEYLVHDINMAGIAFYTGKRLEKGIVKLSVRFPFTTFREAGTAWGRIVYCNQEGERYRVGLAYMRRTRR